VKDWFVTYGWKLVLALIVAALLMAYLVRLERRARGEATVRTPLVATATATAAAARATPASAPTSPGG